MTEQAFHINTKAVLRAWQRLSTTEGDALADPKVSDFPNLLGSLFVLKQVDSGVWTFVNAGGDVSSSIGRDLIEQDFLSLWRGRDMDLIAAQLKTIFNSATPGRILSRAETLSGDTMDVEITLAPLTSSDTGADKMLGLYQMLEPAERFHGRPVWRHTISAIYPPSYNTMQPSLRLIANNE